jgi:methanogenic corrinoid protein MtbC1
MSSELVEALVGMREKDALGIVEAMLDRGESPEAILAQSGEAMRIVGEHYEEGAFFLPELIMSGEMLKKIGALLKPRMAAQTSARVTVGRVVLGTVRGDIHDIGKDIVGFVLDVNGFEVTDLGINVPEDRFVQAVREKQPQVLALSGFLSLAFDTMKSTIEALEQAGLREGLKVIIGGGQIDTMVCEYVGADAYGDDAMAALRIAKETAGVS